MLVYVILLSRAVPLLFWFSLCLVSARFLHDLFLRKGIALAARVVFVSILLFGVAIALPYVRRASLLISAELAYGDANWPAVADRLTTYDAIGGRLDALFHRQLVVALMNLRLWQDAERELLASGLVVAGQRQYTPEMVIQIGICRYYQGHRGEAQTVLRADDMGSPEAYLRHYFLGRLSEAAGDTEGSLTQYEKTLSLRANFMPALYQLVRGNLLLGRRDAAARALTQFGLAYRGLEQNRDFQQLKTAVTGQQPVPPPREFYIVQS